MKSLDVMKSNSELWVLREKIIYTYPRYAGMIVNRDSRIKIFICNKRPVTKCMRALRKERPDLNPIDAHDNCMSEGKSCIH